MATDDLQGGGNWAARVSELLVDSFLAQPLDRLLLPELHGRLGLLLLGSLLRGDEARQQALMQSALAHAVRWLSGQKQLGAALPPVVVDLVRELLRRPYVPDRALTLGLLSAPPLRRLTRELMVGTLLDYGRKLRQATAEPAVGTAPKGGLLGRLASEAVRKGGAAAQAIAPGVTGLLSEELERQMQRRASEFAEGAVDDLLQRAATTLTDPQRMVEQRALKLAILDYVLTLSGADLARELERMEPPAVAELVRTALLRWLDSPAAEGELIGLLQELREAVLGAGAAGTLRELLEAGGALAPVRAGLLTLFAQVTEPVVASGDLGRALAGLTAPATPATSGASAASAASPTPATSATPEAPASSEAAAAPAAPSG